MTIIQPQGGRVSMTQELSTVAIDLAKKVFHLVGSDTTGKILWRKRLSRKALMPFMAQLPPVLIGMEACGGAHYWARRFREPTMRFVPIKDIDQQDIQALHRVRDRLIGERTALVNEVHGLMHEYGIVIPKGVAKFRQAVVGKLEAEKDKLTTLSQAMFWKLVEEFAELEKRITEYQEQLDNLAKTHPECQRLMTIPGIGPITATALVAAVGDVGVFKNGRQFAAWLGLVPRQHSTGGQTRLLGISKRGDGYLRKLLIHGARATLRWVKVKTDGRSQWMRGLLERRGWNRTAVAVANKNARIVWALLSRGGVYHDQAD
jgi:transposase